MDNIKIMIKHPTKELLDEYAKISIKFEVSSIYVLELCDKGLGGVIFKEKQVTPYVKDYDTMDDNPSHLLDKFDLRHWCVVLAYHESKLVGGAIIAFDTEGINMLEGRSDLAVLWDIRIDEPYRGRGVGRKIVQECISWAKQKKCNRLKIETQNINVNACRFYAGQGAELSNINKYCYGDFPEEIQFIWSIDL